MSAPAPPSAAGPLADPGSVRWDAGGLVPVVVQDARDGRILMLACANAEALAATLATGEVHFFSRSRQRLWRKGETSGNVLHLRGLALDCDGDALLATVEPAGPTCHRGTRSCFDPDDAPPDGRSAEPATATGTPSPAIQGFAWLETLWATITDRAERRPAGSYTARLLAAGVDGPARKVAEEATEAFETARASVARLVGARDARGAGRVAVSPEAPQGEPAGSPRD